MRLNFEINFYKYFFPPVFLFFLYNQIIHYLTMSMQYNAGRGFKDCPYTKSIFVNLLVSFNIFL